MTLEERLDYIEKLVGAISEHHNDKADIDFSNVTTVAVSDMYNKAFPVNSLYFGLTETCPLATLIEGSVWELVSQDRVIQGAGSRGTVGATLEESLPNITGSFELATGAGVRYDSDLNGCFSKGSATSWIESYAQGSGYKADFNAHNSSNTYKDNAPVQQNAYLINVWKRTK